MIKWFDLLAVQGTLKSLLQPHSSKASILRRSAFFPAQLSEFGLVWVKGSILKDSVILFFGENLIP